MKKNLETKTSRGCPEIIEYGTNGGIGSLMEVALEDCFGYNDDSSSRGSPDYDSSSSRPSIGYEGI